MRWVQDTSLLKSFYLSSHDKTKTALHIVHISNFQSSSYSLSIILSLSLFLSFPHTHTEGIINGGLINIIPVLKTRTNHAKPPSHNLIS